MKVEYVPAIYVQQQWQDVVDFLSSALEHACGDITLEQLRADLSQNRAALYKFIEDEKVVGAATVVFQNQHNRRVAFVSAIGGNNVAQYTVFQDFSSLLKKAGATHIAGVGRDSIVRLWDKLGLKKKYTVFEAAL